MARKTWKQKLEVAREPQVDVLDKPMMGLAAGTRLLVATPVVVRDFIAGLSCGETRTIPEVRGALAAAYGAEATCPLTTSIFVRIAAEAALDEMREGASVEEITPFWRVVEPGSVLAGKLSCGREFVREQREREASSGIGALGD